MWCLLTLLCVCAFSKEQVFTEYETSKEWIGKWGVFLEFDKVIANSKFCITTSLYSVGYKISDAVVYRRSKRDGY